MTPATLTHVEQEQSVSAVASRPSVSVLQGSRETPMCSASVETVSTTMNVPTLWRALISTVGTHALEPVARMPTVRFATTGQYVHVHRDSQGTHWLAVTAESLLEADKLPNPGRSQETQLSSDNSTRKRKRHLPAAELSLEAGTGLLWRSQAHGMLLEAVTQSLEALGLADLDALVRQGQGAARPLLKWL